VNREGEEAMVTIDLRKRVPGGAAIEFLRVEMAGIDISPFALIRYKKNGLEQPTGLRLDLDKRSFLDHFENREEERIIEAAAPLIVDLVVTEES
jgi:hypothetical protein